MKTEDFKIILELYHNAETSDYCCELEEAAKEYGEVIERFVEPLKKLDDSSWIDAESAITSLAARYEAQGFIQGFKCAAQLKKECYLV